MRLSRMYLKTLKERPSDADSDGGSYLVRACFIQKTAAGFYSFLPLGVRVIANIEAIIREEMARIGAQELRLPLLQPSRLWVESGRYQKMGDSMVRIKDKQDHEFVLSPTAEEMIVDLVRDSLLSYRSLPFNLYQISTKVRDETRPRFGLIRCKEFLMKDGYSFHVDEADAIREFNNVSQAYKRILDRIGLKYLPVAADSGDMGGSQSTEFQVLANCGEDGLVYCHHCGYGANLEKATSFLEPLSCDDEYQLVATPGVKSIEEVASFFGVAPSRLVKTLVYVDADGRRFAVLVRGDYQLSDYKMEKAFGPCRLVEDMAGAGLVAGYVGPVGLSIPVYAEESVRSLERFICGANREGHHLKGVSISDCKIEKFLDLRLVDQGCPCPNCHQSLDLLRGIEVGHIFVLGTKYSTPMGLQYRDAQGESHDVVMGCYGLGVSRLVAAIAEQCHDQHGLVWPVAVAPYQVVVVLALDEALDVALGLASRLEEAGFSVCVDDRDQRLGFKLKDAELIGFPYRLIVGGRSGPDNVEVTIRDGGASRVVAIDEVVDFLGSLAKK